MAIIHKYPVPAYGTQHPAVRVPQGSTIRAVLSQGPGLTPVIYVEKPDEAAQVHDGSPFLDMFFVGTGHSFGPGMMPFIGTVTDGRLVWHVYGMITLGEC